MQHKDRWSLVSMIRITVVTAVGDTAGGAVGVLRGVKAPGWRTGVSEGK